MFLTLGLLVYPSRVAQVLGSGILLSGFLILMARPLSVFLSLSLTNLKVREKLLISWVGIRGAVPIILATFQFIAGLQKAEFIFTLFFLSF